jgi:two-component system LytT family sensor kinase
MTPETAAPIPAQPLRVNWKVAVACALALIVVFSTQNGAVLGGAAARQSFVGDVASQVLGWGIWLLLLPLVFAIGARARIHGLTTRNVALQLLAGMGVALLASTLLATIRWAVGTSPGHTFRFAVTALVSLNFAQSFLRYLMIAAAYHALAAQREARQRDVREARLAASLAEARLESLERRLQPHFLFNTLNAVTSLLRKDPPTAAIMIGHLGDLLRAALDAEPGREVTLADELALLERYTAIQQARFSDRLRVTVSAAPDTLAAYVPHMILQPLVENAIRHGIGPREAPGRLVVEAARQDGVLRLIVRDDGVGFGRTPASTAGKGLGISSTRERLSHLYGSGFSFDIAPAAPRGTVVTIDLPFHVDGPRVRTVPA